MRKLPQREKPVKRLPEYIPAELPRRQDPEQRNNKSHRHFWAAGARSPVPDTRSGSGPKLPERKVPARSRRRGPGKLQCSCKLLCDRRNRSPLYVIRLSAEALTHHHAFACGSPIAGSCSMDEESMTASGGNLIDSEINRNEQSAQWAVAMIEVAGTCYPNQRFGHVRLRSSRPLWLRLRLASRGLL